MKIIKTILTKERKGFMFDFTKWILYDPSALGHVMYIGSVLITLLYSLSLLALFLVKANIFFIVFNIIILFFHAKKFYFLNKARQNVGGISNLYGMSIYDFLWRKK